MIADEINRMYLLALEMEPGLAEKGQQGYDEIDQRFRGLMLNLSCSSDILESIPLQAALLTAVNTGKRCFLGGLHVQLPDDAKCILPYWKGKPMKDVVVELGGKVAKVKNENAHELLFGIRANSARSFQVICNSWTGGVLVKDDNYHLDGDSNFPLGGILAGSLAVALCFLDALGIDKSVFNKSTGMSLWRPDDIDTWYSSKSQGPKVENFPDKLWLLGLGHLGQGYAWSLGLMPFAKPEELEFLLQDFDVLKKGNQSAGLLTEEDSLNKMKTRIVSNWLEQREARTRIMESEYTDQTARSVRDPLILLAGLDSLKARRSLRTNQFKMLIDCGIGGNVGGFDMIRINNFPFNGKTPEELWANAEQQLNMPATKRLTEKLNGCGYVKGIATSFVGAFSAVLVLGELLRAYHKGIKTAYQNLSMRNIENRRVKNIGYYNLNELQTGYTSFQ